MKNLSSKKNFAKIYHIDPNQVNQKSGKYFNIFSETNKVVGGDWDIQSTAFHETLIYRGMHQRFVEKMAWKETVYFKECYKMIAQGDLMWNCATQDEFIVRCENLDTIYKDMKENGYKRSTDKITGGYDEVSINIGRNGELLFNDGAHRLSIAKILSIPSIPVRIIARHKDRNTFIKKLHNLLPNQVSYQSLGHPDLDTNFDIKHSCKDRWQLIEPIVKKQYSDNNNALDIGGNIGFFTRSMADYGYNIDIIEHESFYIKVLEAFKDTLNYKYNIISEDMFAWKDIGKKRYKFVLALNIFHHFIKTETFHKKLITLLNDIKCDYMIFESHNTNETQMKEAYRNYSPKEFVEFIIKNSELQSYEKIGTIDSDGRDLFLIKKDT